jgi:hypothetical protein
MEYISELFKKARFYLFYSAALCSADKKYKAWKKRTEEHRKNYADKIIISYLMIPLDDSISNFKQIGFNILSENEQSVSKDFLKYAELIDQPADLNRNSIIKWIENRNLLTICSEEVKTLFKLMEDEAIKPLDLAKSSEHILNWLSTHQKHAEFTSELRKNLLLRIFQKLGKVFKILKFDRFKKLFGFIDFYECERVIVEGNRTYVTSKSTFSYFNSDIMMRNSSAPFKKRERLFNIKIDPQNKKFTFDSYNQNELVQQKLHTFTREMKVVNRMINQERVIGQKDIGSIFNKVKEQIPNEMKNIQVNLEQDLSRHSSHCFSQAG